MTATKGRLVREYLERVNGEVLEGEHFRSTLASMIKGHAGVYALYKGDALYYVGLATNLMARVNHHLKDRHARRWNRFSVYLTTAGQQIKPIESLLLRITKPVGNKVQGKLPGARDLKADVNRGVKAQQDDERARLLGGNFARVRRRRKAAAHKGSLVFAGSMDKRVPLIADYKGGRFKASLRKDGRISYQRQLFDSPTAAAKAVVGRAVNGWNFWYYKRGREWVSLGEMRR